MAARTLCAFASRRLFRAVLPLLVLTGLLAHLAAPQRGRAALPSTRLLANLPLSFLENRGQMDPRVRYYLQGRNTNVYFTPRGLTFSLAPARLSMEHAAAVRQDRKPRYALKLDFVGGSENARPVGEERTAEVVSYFHGPRARWKTGLNSYSSVVYQDLWPGIDLRYSGAQDRIKYEFVVHPGADPDQIRLAYRGASRLQVNGDGELQVETPAGGFHDARPYAYQDVAGTRREVASGYAVEPVSTGAAHPYHFELGAYDRSKTLVLDPTVILYAGYIGGAGTEQVTAVAVDSAGSAYLAGSTPSSQATFPNGTGFGSVPGVPGPSKAFGGVQDVFVAKVKADGSGLVYVGYIGGSDTDVATGIAVDGAGAAYVVGYTLSTETSFPVRGTLDPTYNGNSQFGAGDAFIAKVRPDGTALEYCGYIGGSAGDQARGVAVDPQGNAYVTGLTESTEATFPVRVGPDVTYNGAADAFIAKVQPDGAAMVYCGYIGGAGGDAGMGIAVDSTGSAYVAGTTTSREGTFPVTGGPDLSFNDIGVDIGDVFVAKVRPVPSSADPRTNFEYCGYLGGETVDQARGIAIDRQGNAFVTGVTGSPPSSFPVKIGPGLVYKDQGDAFVAAIRAVPTDPNVFNNLIYCGYIGGNKQDAGNGIAVDEGGAAYITGESYSDQGTFPVRDGPRLFINSPFTGEAFVAKVQPGGADVEYSGYIGGTLGDAAYGIAVDRSGNAYVGGTTASTGGPNPGDFTTAVGPDLTQNGQWDGFIAKVGRSGPAGNQPPTVTCPAPVSVAATSGRGASVTLTAAVSDPDRGALTVTWNVDGGAVEKADTVAAGGPPTSASLSFTQIYAQGAHTVVISVSDGQAAPVTCSTTVTVNPAAADTVPPTLTSCVVGTRTLPGSGGAVGLSVLATDNVGVTSVAASMALAGVATNIPLSRDRSGRYVGTFTAPANTTHNPRIYAASFTAADAAGNQRTVACGSVTVAGIDDTPPVLASCTVEPRTLTSLGGAVSIKLRVTDDVGVRTVTAAATLGGVVKPIPLSPVKLGGYLGTFAAPQNVTRDAQVHAISVTATDTAGNQSTTSCGVVTVAGDNEAPVIGNCSVSPRSLDYRGSTRVTVRARVADSTGISSVEVTLTRAEAPPITARLSRAGTYFLVSGIRIPPNMTLQRQAYRVEVSAADPLGNSRTVLCGFLAVANVPPPQIRTCSVTPTLLPPVGGDVHFQASVVDRFRVVSATATLMLKGVSTEVPLTAVSRQGSAVKFTGTFTAPPNPTTQAQVYSVVIKAVSASGVSGSRSCGTVTVAARGVAAPAARRGASGAMRRVPREEVSLTRRHSLEPRLE